MRAFLYDGSDMKQLDTLESLPGLTAGLPYWWLDIEDPPEGQRALLGVVDDASTAVWLARFGQVPRFHWTDAGLRVVVPVFADGHPVEVNALSQEGRLVTTHGGGGAVFDEIRSRTSQDKNPPTGMAALVLLLEDMLDTFRPVLAELRREVYEVSDSILMNPSRDQMQELAALRRRVNDVRGSLMPYADAAEDFVDRLTLLPDVPTADGAVIQGHAAHAGAMARQVEALQDAASHAMEVYVSMVTTRQGQVINWLTFVSIVFLPLTFITGFFGMNFDWMVNNVSGASHFWVLGVGLQVMVVALVFIAGRRLFPVLRGDVRGGPTSGLDDGSGAPPSGGR